MVSQEGKLEKIGDNLDEKLEKKDLERLMEKGKNE